MHRPDGNPENPESGSYLGHKTAPLKPKEWYTLRWLITSKGMAVYTNDRLVWSERRAYAVDDMKGPVMVRAVGSVVDVKELTVHPAAPKD